MAIPSRSQTSWYFSLKLLLFSTAILTAALFLKLSIPVAVSALPVLWKTAVLWLTPPYLYVVLNFIIITIAASSRYQHKQMGGGQGHAVEVPMKLQVDPRSDYGFSTDLRSEYGSMLGFDAVLMKSPSPVSDATSNFEVLERTVVRSPVKEVEVKSFPVVASDREFDDFVIKRSALAPVLREAKEIWVPALTTESSVLTEKPPATVRFAHRRSSKASPDGSRTLGVSKPKRHDTLESTWKTITDGRSIPLARHLKKSETFETHGRHAQESSTASSKMKKSETLNERHSGNSSLSPSPGSGKMRKEPSLSQDELNRRVEAFIKKFNEEMRLQRQESLNQYKQMVKRH